MATVAKSDRSTTITLASASAGPFDLTFRLFDDDGLDVYVNDQQVTNFAISSNYVDGYDDNATITFDASLQPGDVIRVDAALTPGRAADYLDGPNLTYLQNIEFARIWSTLAELKRDSRRSVRFFDNVSPLAFQAGRMLVVNSDGNGIELGAQTSDIPLAQGYAAEAKAWARTAEDTEVQPGEFSALHWAAKAADSAAAAATFDPANFYTKVQADAQFLTPAEGDSAYLGQVPVGTVLPFAGNAAPAGFLKLNGATISRTTYAALFAHLDALGLAGPGDGSTTFDLPDARGYGLRFWDDGRGKDSGRALGSFQDDAVQNMSGTFNNVITMNTGIATTGVFTTTFLATPSLAGSGVGFQRRQLVFESSGSARSASETRMANYALLAVIKY